MCPCPAPVRILLFEVFSHTLRAGPPSCMTTNLPFEWTEVFGLERRRRSPAVHRRHPFSVHILEMNG